MNAVEWFTKHLGFIHFAAHFSTFQSQIHTIHAHISSGHIFIWYKVDVTAYVV
jgi:hypothetical protein